MIRLPTLAKRISRVVPAPLFARPQGVIRLYSEKVSTQESAEPQKEEPEHTIDVPWYLRDDVASPLHEEKKIELPSISDSAPVEVSKFCHLLAEEYGMSDIDLFDMTELDDSHEFKANNKDIDYIIICTGKSEKHNFKAAGEFRHYLKHEYNYSPVMEGMVNGAMSPIMRRRLLRRASRGPPATFNDYGKAANSWIMCHHDHIDVHIMTKERREDLNLESLWCKPEDAEKYAPKEQMPTFSDHIFSGIRRFHTSARTLYANLMSLESNLTELQNLSMDASDQDIKARIDAFEADISNPTFKDHNLRYELYRSVHLTRPDLVSFAQAEEALLAKYASLELAFDKTVDYSDEKSNDVVKYIKLIIDSPEWSSPNFEHNQIDKRFNQLSSFLRVIYCFSQERFNMTANPELVPLLWRLSLHEDLEPITPLTVDRIIQDGEEINRKAPAPSLHFASNKLRDVLFLLSRHESLDGSNSELTGMFQELILFTYGNAWKWDKFWNQWATICLSRIPPTKEETLRSWLRLTVFLSLTNNRAQILHYFSQHWDVGSEAGGTMMKALRDCDGKFPSANEETAFKNAVISMLDRLGDGKFEKVRDFIDEL